MTYLDQDSQKHHIESDTESQWIYVSISLQLDRVFQNWNGSILTAVDQDILQCSQDAEVAVNHQIHFVK
jgi:hypothetical protein